MTGVDGDFTIENGKVVGRGLKPQTDYCIRLYLKTRQEDGGISCVVDSIMCRTADMDYNIECTASSVSATFDNGYATIHNPRISIAGENTDKTVSENHATFLGLDPDTEYSMTFTFTAGDSVCSKEISARTLPLNMTTEQPKVLKPGNVLVSARANVSPDEEGIGFEWRRTDWTEEFASNKGMAFCNGQMMDGMIYSLNTERLWKYRPYYQSASGQYYHGEWVGIDPTNTSYFEPVVRTNDNPSIEGNTALLSGYALSGTETVSTHGFKYWKKDDSAGAKAAILFDEDTGSNGSSALRQVYYDLSADAAMVSVPEYAQTIIIDTDAMKAEISGLAYNTTYEYVAFARIDNGKEYYSELCEFTTSKSANGDVNHDGSVTMADANMVVNYFLATKKPEDFDIETADVNCDGFITMADANMIVNMFLGGK